MNINSGQISSFRPYSSTKLRIKKIIKIYIIGSEIENKFNFKLIWLIDNYETDRKEESE